MRAEIKVTQLTQQLGGSEHVGHSVTPHVCVQRGRSCNRDLQIPLTFSQNWAVTWGNKKTQTPN